MAGTTQKEIDGWFEDLGDKILDDLFPHVAKIGEEALALARNEHVYTTRTGNLQSSCGFAITRDGQVLQPASFTPQPGREGDGTKGAEEGKKFMDECLQGIHKKGMTLILVAGMDYAGHVEDWGGDVLKSAETYVRNQFDQFLKK